MPPGKHSPHPKDCHGVLKLVTAAAPGNGQATHGNQQATRGDGER
ncbi:hypothetical protein SALCHL_004651 [Streptomyces albus subsp. chlorinus]|nr:hypothetical protein [Streptomyces albus]